MARYPASLEPEGDGFNVTFRDIPEAFTCGGSREDALEMAAGALVTAMEFYFDDRRPVPLPSAQKDEEVLIALPPSVWTKVLLLNEMIGQRVTPAELARRLNTRPQEVTRIINLGHATKIDTIAVTFPHKLDSSKLESGCLFGLR